MELRSFQQALVLSRSQRPFPLQLFDEQGVSAEAIDLDPWSPTLALIRGEISKEERDSLKRKRIGLKEIQDTAKRLKEVAKGHDFVVEDTLGEISGDMRPVYQAATHAI